jgi:hypothetical protein
MSISLRRSPLTALAVVALLAACVETTSEPRRLVTVAPHKKLDPRNDLLDPGAPGLIVICSSGGPASFTVTATPNVGTLAGGGSFSLTDGECVTAWQAVANDLQTVKVVVRETAGDFDHIEATAVPIIGLPRMVIDNTNEGVKWDTNADHGGSATFFQTVATPPESKKLVVCKQGPAGTYTFTVSSDASTGNVFPNGTTFTVDAGQCKDAWMADKPPEFPVDPNVTVSEQGDAPLDSIVKEPQDSLPTTLLGTRDVTTRVGWYHGGVVTYYNSVCLDQNATNFGGTPPCRFPPPSVSCVAITAVQGVAITPVTLTASGGAGGPYTFSATGLPAGVTMASDGTISGTPTVSGTFSYTVTVTDKDGNTGTSTCEVNVGPPPSVSCVAITAVQGVAITPVTLTASGGSGAPYTFSATGLPAGLSISSSGTISGTPTVSGTFSYTVTVTDKDGNTGSSTCSVTVNPPPSVSCVNITAVQGTPIAPVTLTASGGAGAPYTFSATGLPAGLSISSSGTISGTPTVSGTFSYTVTVTDKDGNTGTSTCSVTVNPPPPQFCSYTPGGWGAPPNGGNVASTLYKYFASVYPTGVTIGITGVSGKYYMKWTQLSAITAYLTTGGTPGTLTKSYTNPAARNESGELGNQVLALKFNVDFSNAGKIKPGFSTAVVTSGPLAGLTTAQVLSLANSALGGKTSVLTPYGITVKDLTTILGSINGAFDGCTTNTGYLR